MFLSAAGEVRRWVDRDALEKLGILARDLLDGIDVLKQNGGRRLEGFSACALAEVPPAVLDTKG